MTIAIIAITLTFATIICVATNLLKSKYYPYALYGISLGLLYSTSLLGRYVVGSDISGELLSSVMVMERGWDITFYEPNATSWVISGFIPWISNLLSIEPQWIYKIFLPLVFATVPVILYLAFKKMIGEKRGMYSALFFVVMPVFFLEIVTIGKSMVAEVFLALVVLVMVSDWKSWIKATVFCLCIVLAIITHYTIGILLIGFLVCAFLVMAIVKFIPKWKLFSNKKIPLWLMGTATGLSLITFVSYYSVTAQGYLIQQTLQIGRGYQLAVERPDLLMLYMGYSTTDILAAMLKENDTHNLPVPDPVSVSLVAEKRRSEALNGQLPEWLRISYLNHQPPLVRAAVGLDFMEASALGKVFRIVQFLTQGFIILGCVAILIGRRYKITAEFIACIGGAFALLMFCIFVPNFSSLINMTRFFHTSLFFLAPCFVLGVEMISLRRKENVD